MAMDSTLARCGLAFFGKGKKKGGDDGGSGEPAKNGDDGQGFTRSLRNANKFFDYGDTAADATNYDYAVECYIGGLRHNPDSMERHEQLHEIAKRRSVNGGKPMKTKKVGPSLVDKMLTAEKAWAFDWNNVDHIVDCVEAAVDAEARAGEEANLREFAQWAADLAVQYNANPNAKPNRKAYVRIVDAMDQEHIGGYHIALEAARRALNIKDEDALRDRIKDLTAKNYTQQADAASAEEGARGMLKDAEAQAQIQAELDTTGSQTDKLIATARENYEENPEDMDLLQKLVDALLRPEEGEKDKEAVALLLKAHSDTGQYRFKMKAGDVRLKSINRALRALNDKAKAGDEAARAKLQDGLKKRLAFELQEFSERSQNYPTDLKLKFELGKRQLQAGQFDDAIGNLQEATREPKSRSAAHLFLGQCFVHKDWMDEAISTLQRGIDQHPVNDDKTGKDLRYDLMVIKMKQAEKEQDAGLAKEAQELASELLQTDINYKDIRQKMDEVRKLSDAVK